MSTDPDHVTRLTAIIREVGGGHLLVATPLAKAILETLSITAEDIPPGPYSEHELRDQWNARVDENNQWDSLDSSEQLAWAQVRAIAAARDRHRTYQPALDTGSIKTELELIANRATDTYQFGDANILRRAADLIRQQHAELMRHQFSAPAPAVALCERPPTEEAGDLDRAGRCWWGNAGGGEFVPSWRLCEGPHDSRFTHWRPHHSIPLPQAGEVKA
jgi:hypothetical protein